MAVDDVLRTICLDIEKLFKRVNLLEHEHGVPPIQWQGNPAEQELFPAAQDLSKIYKVHGQFKVEEETSWSGNPSMAALHNTIRELREELAVAYDDVETFGQHGERVEDENKILMATNDKMVGQIECLEAQVVHFGNERNHAESRRKTIFDVNEILVDKKRELHVEIAALQATVKQYKSGLAGAQEAARIAAAVDDQRQAHFDQAKNDVDNLEKTNERLHKGRGEIKRLQKSNTLLKFEAENEKELRTVTERECYDESAGLKAEIHTLRNTLGAARSAGNADLHAKRAAHLFLREAVATTNEWREADDSQELHDAIVRRDNLHARMADYLEAQDAEDGPQG